MRRAAAAIMIAACVLISMATSGGAGLTAPEVATHSLQIQKQTPRRDKPAPVAAGNDSCRWANDNECDDPDIGTGACPIGTDVSDCRAVRAGDDDSCQWARDGECDEPGFGTGACRQATDRSDCGDLSRIRNRMDSCATAFNGVCDEPGLGKGACEARTDRSDCLGRGRPLSITDHFFGRDDRVLVPVNQRPWSFMGMLHTDSGQACTATLIARNVIVTAAHCLYAEYGLNPRGVFESANGGHTARVTAYLIDRRFDYRRFAAGEEIDGMDWALLRLDRPLGDRLGFAGVRNLTAQGQQAAAAADLMQAGYSWDTGRRLSGNLNCHIVRVNADNTFAHECDTTRGDSGSAFLVRTGRGYDVIGVDSNFRSNPDGPFIYIAVSAAAFAPRVPDFIAGRSGIRVGGATTASRKGG